MKKQLLTLLAMVTMLAMPLQMRADDIEINETTFPDENFRSWVLSQDYGQDGVLTEDEIARVKNIDITGKNITTLKGIEYFTALTGLWCFYNQLTSLDVSQNTALTKLSCSDNQLTSLDVSHNTALTVLECGRNQLTSLDVSQNTALTWLECGSNQLTSLDVSQNTALTELGCSDNQLTSLDVSQNTALKWLACSNNQLTSLDVSKNTALTELACSDNQLTSLDVSQNTALTSLYCYSNQLTSLDVSQNTALTILYCRSNQLTSLDVSKNTALTWLECGSNQLTSLDVSKNTALTGLSCYSNQLTSLDVLQNTALTRLWCFDNRINETEMGNLVESLSTVNGGELYVKYPIILNEQNVITPEQVAVAKAKGWTVYAYDANTWSWFEYNGDETITGIKINETTFPDENFRNWVLYQAYGKDGVLTETEIAGVTSIDVYYTNIANLKGIEYFTALRELYCHSNQLTSLDVSQNMELTTLRCSSNQLTSLDVSKNTALTLIDCTGNQLTSLDVSQNTALTTFSCGGNQLTSLDVSQNTTLTWLYCENNQLTSLDVSQNTALTSLYCENNRINETEMGNLVESLPTVSSGGFYVKYPTDWGEQNVITTSQVASAKAKGWTVYAYDKNIWNWAEYDGDEPSLSPITTETTINTNNLNGQDLSDNIVDDVYYNLGNDGYDATDGSIVISETTDMSLVTDATPGSADVVNNFTGVILQVGAGKGTITINVKTTGNAQLAVQIGNQTPTIATRTEQGDIVVNYDVPENTFIYIYAIVVSSDAPSLRASSTNMVKIYSIKVTPGATVINSMHHSQCTIDNYYTLDGQKLDGIPTKKGVYIVNGRKVVVK